MSKVEQAEVGVALEANDALQGIIQIARNEQLKQGVYLTEDVVDHMLEEQGAICGGHQACLVGSLYLSAGIKRRKRSNAYRSDSWTLPGVEPGMRSRYMRDKPALKLAYDYLNEAAYRYMLRNHKAEWEDYKKLQEDCYETVSIPPAEGWGEFIFETLLPNPDNAETHRQELENYQTTRDAVIKIAKNAKRNLSKDHLFAT